MNYTISKFAILITDAMVIVTAVTCPMKRTAHHVIRVDDTVQIRNSSATTTCASASQTCAMAPMTAVMVRMKQRHCAATSTVAAPCCVDSSVPTTGAFHDINFVMALIIVEMVPMRTT